MKKKYKKAEWLSEEVLQINEERKQVRGKAESNRYTQLNAEFQRIRRDNKAFLNKQNKEIDENNRLGKTRDFFKKIGDIKGKFHSRKDIIKNRNSKDLREAEMIKKRWQKYIEELYKKDLNDQGNHDGVVTHLEMDILERVVKWARGSITMNKSSGV